MKAFMNDDFLLSSDTAKTLYNSYAVDCPIIDYHCHIDPMDIALDVRFENITQVWLKSDHYKWRLMRAAGVEEKYITGDASDRQKFLAWAGVLGKAIGNPLYHWSHLELRRYFNYQCALSDKTADEVWQITSNMLTAPGVGARDMITRMNVELICTTDDPIDDLKWHRQIAEDTTFKVRVLPTFRPDRVIDIEKSDFPEYIAKLEEVSQTKITCLPDLLQVLRLRMDFFAQMGCHLSDHGMESLVFEDSDLLSAGKVFELRLAGNSGVLSDIEVNQYKTALMLYCAKAYHELGWTMQLHFGCRRDNNQLAYRSLGANTGFDCISGSAFVTPLVNFLNELELESSLPRMIVYSLNPNDNAIIDTVLAAFQSGPVPGKLQHGSAWWFNDNLDGIRNHLISLAGQGYLPAFTGMLTDSRSFLSYPRHEYFRRILCELLGQMVTEGMFPNDPELLGSIVQDICYHNAANLFS